jgi:hypothetical protein
MRLHGDYELDLSFQRGCGQNIESNTVICCLHLFSLGYKSTVGLNEVGSQGESDLVNGRIPEMGHANNTVTEGLFPPPAPTFQKAKRGATRAYLGHAHSP